MKFDLRSQVTRLFANAKTRFHSARSTVVGTVVGRVVDTVVSSVQPPFRWLRLRLSTLTNLNPRSTLLQVLALAVAALMTVLAIGGIQTIAREAQSSQTASDQVRPAPAPNQKPQTWGGLPNVAAGTSASQRPNQRPTAAAPKSSPSAQAVPSKPAQSKSTQSKPAQSPKAAQPQAAPPSPVQPTVPPQPISPVPSAVLTQSSLNAIAPPQQVAPADPSNYGDRYAVDISGTAVKNAPLIVLHETVWSADSAINTVQTAHPNENDQSSYHSIIRLDGTVVYVVPPEKRAFGAGNSVFKSSRGLETVKTHHAFPPSVNNFAYHISLETPPDGYDAGITHSGYTDAQYHSLAWLVAHTSVTNDRVTTHRAIDQSGSRIDPRSFDASKFYTHLKALPRPYLESSRAPAGS